MSDREGAGGDRRRLPSAARLRERFSLLLVAIIAAFVVQGVATPAPLTEVLITTLLAATLLLALWAADARPRLTQVAGVLALGAVVASLVEAASGNLEGASTRAANLLLVTLAPPAVVVGVLRGLRERRQVTVEAVFGVLCLYILLGMFFAFIYGTVARFGHAFFAGGESATTARCLYYSFTTLTTTGYGDLTAATNLGHTLSVLEALVGQIYLVTVVAVIVGNLGRRRDGAT